MFKPLPPLPGGGGCGAADAVLLEGVVLRDHTQVAIAPAATLRCEMAEAVADWLREDVAPAAQKLGAALRAVDNFNSYECRSRNRIPGAMLSEQAVPMRSTCARFKLADGRAIGLTRREAWQ